MRINILLTRLNRNAKSFCKGQEEFFVLKKWFTSSKGIKTEVAHLTSNSLSTSEQI